VSYIEDTHHSSLTRDPSPQSTALSVEVGLNFTNDLTFDDRLDFGVAAGYCSPQFCDTHDGPPLHESEDKSIEYGGDPCIHVVRLGSYEEWDVGE
jgi:hypothetical protein